MHSIPHPIESTILWKLGRLIFFVIKINFPFSFKTNKNFRTGNLARPSTVHVGPGSKLQTNAWSTESFVMVYLLLLSLGHQYI
jgi:hypothetical protein